MAFEYGVDYGGSEGRKPRDCVLSNHIYGGDCDGGYWNLDLYVKFGKFKVILPYRTIYKANNIVRYCLIYNYNHSFGFKMQALTGIQERIETVLWIQS